MGGADTAETGGAAGSAWLHERAELLTRLAEESARAALLEKQLRDRQAVRAEPVTPRDAGARLLHREVERHQAELARVQQAERVALDRAEALSKQLRDLRAELRTVQAEHATERMRAELELARAKAEAAGLQAAARRRADWKRQADQERESRRAEPVEQPLPETGPEPVASAPEPAQAEPVVIVPPEWTEPVTQEAPGPSSTTTIARPPLVEEPPVKQRRPGLWRR